MSPDRPRVVFDCNVFVQAFLNATGPSCACLRLVEDHRILLLLSAQTVAEARDVLKRPFVHERLPDLTEEHVESFLSELAYVAELCHEVPRVQEFRRDPKDEPYLDLAIAARADYIVTRDKDLLSLNTDYSIESSQFRQRHQNRLRIITPVDFLIEIDG